MTKKLYKFTSFFGISFILLITMISNSVAANFTTRCNDPDVVRCWGFDDIAVVSPGLSDAWGNSSYSGEDKCTNKTCKTVDTTIKASGAGSLRMEIPSNSYADTSGNWKGNFSDDLSVQFGEGEEFYVQWRQRFSSSMLNTQYTHIDGTRGWKTIIIGEGDRPGYNASSCTALEIVLHDYWYRRAPQAYWGCGSGGVFTEGYGNFDFKLQNAYDAGINANPRYCLYGTGTDVKPVPGCFNFQPDEWMTFQVRTKVGTWGQANSEVDVWAGREGQSSVLLISHRDVRIVKESSGSKYGKVWFTPYNTEKNGSQVHATGYTWYDDLIVSRKRIPDPIDQPRPSAPGNVIAR